MATRPLLVLLAACVLAGCGEQGPTDEERIRSTLTRFERATAAGDHQALCDRILAPALVEAARTAGLPCEVALEKGFEDLRQPRLTVGAVTVDGDRATAQVRSSAAGEAPSEDVVELVRIGGEWRIASLAAAP